MSKPVFVKTIKIVLVAILLSASAFMLWWLWVAGPQTVWKIITYDDSSIDDYMLFPARPLTASTTPFQFAISEDADRMPQTISTAGIAEQSLDDFLRTTDTTAFLVIKDDDVLMEHYFDGYDEATPSLAFSMSKSFLSILIGTAIDDGIIASIDMPVTGFVPELADAGFDAVTIRHLLQMTSGMDYVEIEGNPFSRHDRFFYTNRLEHELLRLDSAESPGQTFAYKSGENALLGLILSRALAPQTITDYTQARLWEPLGMEYDGAWNLDHPDGLEKTWCCLSATARDYAKLGRLYLNEGDWSGEEVVSADWVRQSTRIDTSDGSAWNYQHQWWLVSEDGGDFTAMGHLGQFVYVNTIEDVVIVRLGTSRGGLEWDQWQAVLAALAEEIAP
jgi:CubicO group peptidase (beta-lactamase class C family)